MWGSLDLKVPLHEIPLIQRVTAQKDQIRSRGIAIAGVALHGFGRAIIGKQLDDRRIKHH